MTVLTMLAACSEPKAVTICEVAAHPNAFEGKVVRVRVNLIMGRHGAVAYGPSCPSVRFEYEETEKFKRSGGRREFSKAVLSHQYTPALTRRTPEDFQADVHARVSWRAPSRDLDDETRRRGSISIEEMHSFHLVQRAYANAYEEAMASCVPGAMVGQDLDVARKACSQAVALRGTTDSHFYSGLVALDDKRFADARTHFDTAYVKNPNNYDALFGRGLAERGLGNDAEARRDMNEARRLSATLPPTDPAGEMPIWFERFSSELSN